MGRPHQARSFVNLRGFAHTHPVILRRGAGENYRIPVSQRITKTAAAAEGRMTQQGRGNRANGRHNGGHIVPGGFLGLAE